MPAISGKVISGTEPARCIFRNPLPDVHQDFGPRFATYFRHKDGIYEKIGAHPDMDGPYWEERFSRHAG